MDAGKGISMVFDVDGTLVDSDGFDVACFVEAVRAVLGEVKFREDWKGYRHATDSGILRQIMEENGITSAPALTAEVREVFGVKVREYLDAGGACEPVPGAAEALRGLRAQGLGVGIATGGWGHTARMKLDRARIPSQGLPMASCDFSPDRVKIMGECLRLLGGNPARAIYVGNGEWDLEASRRAGWAFIGVGPRLENACQVWVPNFREPAWTQGLDSVLARLGPPRPR
jgi:phosphoglycolate phosphatase-like HAD superfamily hydrolase